MKSSATVKGVYESSDLLFSVEIVEGNEEEVKYKVLGEDKIRSGKIRNSNKLGKYILALNQRVYIR